MFGVFAATYYWFPKMTGRMLNDRLGKVHFWIHFIGFNLAFFPMHQLGLSGMPRRVSDYADRPDWVILNMISTVGAFMIAVSIIPFLVNVDRHASSTASRPATIRGRATRWSGRRRARRRRTTSTACRRSTPSGRSSS